MSDIKGIVIPAATLYWWSCDFRRFNGDFLVGDVLLTGRSDGDGEITSLPQELLDLFFTTEIYKAEFLAAGEASYATNSVRFDNWYDAIRHGAQLARRRQLVVAFRVAAA